MPNVTNWFPKKIKPVYAGFYEVNMDSWPWPTQVEWAGDRWLTDIKIWEWRGLQEPVEYITIED